MNHLNNTNTAELIQGKSLYRFGFPFAEFSNFTSHSLNDEINFTTTGNINSPSLPIEGMVTRHVSDGQNIVGVELNTPGLRGQNGGPLFDREGLIYGTQSEPLQYHLGFDEKNIEIMRKDKKISMPNHSFLNVGRCVQVEAIKAFLKLNAITYYES